MDADGKVVFDLDFVDEPLGSSAEMGYGWPQLEFGEAIGPDKRYTIVRKLGWGLSSSAWLAKDELRVISGLFPSMGSNAVF